ncbi:hypothetical protein GPJ56_003132 [Histomonas meleagridis]|uniref:uncharacterized protein n=1 Tax=Histomonas meleagridis TaxID=135588 RepID=UPI003559D8CE|nr:hypothetical protein GPJ56_003132 [Histomonas meleagridis]KAH0800628.1 hypothetical protein GO595_006381 [Histomonas meleagridis]
MFLPTICLFNIIGYCQQRPRIYEFSDSAIMSILDKMHKHDYDEIEYRSEVRYLSNEDDENDENGEEYVYEYELDENGDFVYEYIYEYVEDPMSNGFFKKIKKAVKKVVKKVTKPVTKVVKKATKTVAKTVKSTIKTVKDTVKATIKATTSAVKIATKITKATVKIATNPGKIGKIIKDLGKGVTRDLKAAAKAYKPVVRDIKKEVKRAFKAIKSVAPYVGFVTCWVPVVGQIGLAASIATTMSTAYKAYALYQAGMSVYQGIKQKDFVSALGGIAAAVGGNIGGAIGTVAQKAAEAQQLYKQGELIYKGIKKGDYSKIIAGVTSLVSKDVAKQLISKSELLQQGLEYYQRGYNLYKKGKQVTEAIKTGHFGKAIDGLAELGLDIRKNSLYTKAEQLFDKASNLYYQGETLYKQGKEKLDLGKAAYEAIRYGKINEGVTLLKQAGVDVTKNQKVSQCLTYYNDVKNKYAYAKTAYNYAKKGNVQQTVTYLQKAGINVTSSKAVQKGLTYYKEIETKVNTGKTAYEYAKKGKVDEAAAQLKKIGIDITKNQALQNALDLYKKGETLYKQGDALYKQGKTIIQQGKTSFESLRKGQVTQVLNDLAGLGIDLRKYDAVKQGETIVKEVERLRKTLPKEVQTAAEIQLGKLVLLGLNTTIYAEIDEAMNKAKSASLTVYRSISNGFSYYKDGSGRVGTLASLAESRFQEIIDLEGSSEYCRDLDLVTKIFTGSTVGEQIAQKVTEGYLKLENAQAKADAQIEKVAQEVQGKATKLVTSIEELQEIIKKAGADAKKKTTK